LTLSCSGLGENHLQTASHCLRRNLLGQLRGKANLAKLEALINEGRFNRPMLLNTMNTNPKARPFLVDIDFAEPETGECLHSMRVAVHPYVMLSLRPPAFAPGMTLLMVAASEKRLDAFELFLKNGANPALQDSSGRTAVYHAIDQATSERDCLKFLQLLARLGEHGEKQALKDKTEKMAHLRADFTAALSAQTRGE
jgi:hypothetical protein